MSKRNLVLVVKAFVDPSEPEVSTFFKDRKEFTSSVGPIHTAPPTGV
jgi:hypothetical protein